MASQVNEETVKRDLTGYGMGSCIGDRCSRLTIDLKDHLTAAGCAGVDSPAGQRKNQTLNCVLTTERSHTRCVD